MKDMEGLISFENKTVALVGSAGYLSDYSFGKEIDNHDIVVRVNKGVDIVNNTSFLKLGSKTDVLYHHLLEDPKESNGPKFGFINPEKWKKMGVKNVFCLPSSSFEGIATCNQLSNLVNISNIKKIIRCFDNSKKSILSHF